MKALVRLFVSGLLLLANDFTVVVLAIELLEDNRRVVETIGSKQIITLPDAPFASFDSPSSIQSSDVSTSAFSGNGLSASGFDDNGENRSANIYFDITFAVFVTADFDLTGSASALSMPPGTTQVSATLYAGSELLNANILYQDGVMTDGKITNPDTDLEYQVTLPAGTYRFRIAAESIAELGFSTFSFYSFSVAFTGDEADSDSDSVHDGIDNCTDIANPNQVDSNGDGYGNACDPDLDNNGIVNYLDVALLSDVFLTNDADADFNTDGVVNFLDYFTLLLFIFSEPGPSALAL